MKSLGCLALFVPMVAHCAGCHTSQASNANGPQIPAGQVWLTASEVADNKIEVTTIAEQDVDDTVLTSGTVLLDDMRTGHVLSPVTGRVVTIKAQLGDRVKKGDTLAVIESPDIGAAVSDVHKAQADLILAEATLARKRDLRAQGAASDMDVEQAEDSARNKKAELERARQKEFLLHLGNVDVVTQTYALTAPIEGEVLLRQINPGMEVQGQYSGGSSQTPDLFTIGELDRVWVLGDIYEIDLGRVHVGTPAQVTVVAYPGKVFKGTVDWLSGALDPNTRTAKVRCTFENPDRLLRPMMYSTVQIAVDQRKALAIPRDAVKRMGEYKLVFVQVGESDGRVKFERVPVDVDDREGNPWLEVKHGLDASQRIVVNGKDFLSQKL